MDFGIVLTANEIRLWMAAARQRRLLTVTGLADRVAQRAADLLYPRSLQRTEWDALVAIRLDSKDALLVVGPNEAGFEGERVVDTEPAVWVCPLDRANAEHMRHHLPFTAPVPVGGFDVTFGAGDRLGFASPGALRLFHHSPAVPVVAQQSVRELELTCRSFEEVLAAATWSVFQEGFARPWGADGDHLKTVEWVRKALQAGFTMITADVSDYIRAAYSAGTDEAVTEAWQGVGTGYRQRIEADYGALAFRLDDGESVRFPPAELARTALVYREAVEHAERLYRAGVQVRGEGAFDFELSIDETTFPTTPQAHLFVAREAQRLGVRISSLAPRFVGEFQKGIDYIGDPEAFRRGFHTHAALARALGYRISVHSGSDKFAIFQAVGEESRGRFHLKTSGTNWLEALRVTARLAPVLFRRIYRLALGTFAKSNTLYHTTPDLQKLPDATNLSEEAMAALFEDADARRVLHISYGEVLADADLSRALYDLLRHHLDDYRASVERHLGRHLDALGIPHGE